MKMQITIEKIGFLIILITIVLLNIFIGSNIKQPIWTIQTIVSIFTLIYLINSKIHKKQNVIIKGKIDIAVLLFMVSTIIPLILKTYASLEGTINFILKYWSVFGFYILVRNIVIDDKKIKIIINTIIISSIIPIIFGIDKMTVNIFEPFLDLIEAVKIEDYRMISTFGYANTFAAYLGLTTSLAISQLVNVKGKIKIPYAIYIIISVITILLTQSKFVIALLAVIVMIFIIKGIKDKKISKKFIITGIVAIIAFFIYFFIAIKIDKPLEITQDEKNCVIRGIESNTEYEFALDIDAKTEKDYHTFEIKVVEVTRYFSEKIIGKITFGNFDGIKKIQVETNEEIDHIEIRIKNQLNQELTINNLKINDSPYILEYKIIPDEIVRIFTTFNFKNSSVWQRADYWRDGIDILKQNWLIGAGGNTWRILYGQVQDYLYYAKEVHCYVLEIWMSFGILGILSYIFIVAITTQNVVLLLKKSKQNLKQYRIILAILVGISIITIHSLMDFDMSYLIIEMIFYMFIAIMNKEDKNLDININIIEIIITAVFIIISIGNTLGFIADKLEDTSGITSNKIAPWISRYQYNKIVYVENNKIEDENKMEYLKKYIENEPYQHQNVIYEIMCNEIIKNPKIEDIEYIINVWRNIEKERIYEIEPIKDRAETMLEFAKNLLENKMTDKAEEVLEQVRDEYQQNSEIILDYRRNRESETITKFEYGYYTDTYNEAIQLLEK